MKKYFYNLMTAAALLLAVTACSSEEEIVSSGTDGKGTEVTFQIALEDAAASRAADHKGDDDIFSRGTKVSNVYAEVYTTSGRRVAISESNPIVNKKATVNFRLISGQSYRFVFWADVKNNDFYTIDNSGDKTVIKVNYKGNANDEERDAFTRTIDFDVNRGGITETVELWRPFAQLNIASTAEDHAIAEAANFACHQVKSTIEIKGLYNTYDLFSNSIVTTSTSNTELELHDIPARQGEVLKNVKMPEHGTTYNFDGYLSMNYFLAPDNAENIEVKATFVSDVSGVEDVKISVSNVPVRRNYRTNIIGNILTEQSVFNIIIDPEFEGEYVVGWDGKTTEQPKHTTTNGYEIKTPAHLAWVAEQVNNGTKTFSGETVTLMDNIHLGNQNWTPIGVSREKSFQGTFNGNGKVVYDFDVCCMDTPAGLFGYLNGTVKDLFIEQANVAGNESVGIVVGKIDPTGLVEKVTVMNSTVEGHHWVGGIVGYAYGSVNSSNVENVTVTATPNAVSRAISYVDGDKAGGLIGYLGEGDYHVEGNNVTNVTVTAYRDLGGLIGAAQEATIPNVKGNTVTNTTIVRNRSEYSSHEDASDAENYGAILGRIVYNEKIEAELGSNTHSGVKYEAK